MLSWSSAGVVAKLKLMRLSSYWLAYWLYFVKSRMLLVLAVPESPQIKTR